MVIKTGQEMAIGPGKKYAYCSERMMNRGGPPAAQSCLECKVLYLRPQDLCKSTLQGTDLYE